MLGTLIRTKIRIFWHMRNSHLFNLSVPVALIAAAGLGVGFAPRLLTHAVQVKLAVVESNWLYKSVVPSSPRLVFDSVATEKGLIRKVVSTSGPVRALVTVSVGSQLSGLIDKLYVDYNAEVKAGDLLATIDARTFESRVAQARADLLAAKAGVVNQEAAMKRVIAVMQQAERATERQLALQKKGFAAKATLENAERDLIISRAEIDVVKAQIESAKAVVAQREAALKSAEVDLERAKIIAPVDGTVISRTVDVGQTVAASLQAPELFKIAQDIRRIRIEAQVNEADVGAVAEGNPCTFSVDAYPDRTFEGKVTQVRLAATELNNVVTYTVIIEASNDDRRLFPGMTANVQIEAAKKEDALRVPNDALRFKPRGQTSQSGSGGSDRTERLLGRLKNELQLTRAQEEAVRGQIGKSMAAVRNGSQGTNQAEMADPAGMRQRMMVAVEQTLRPLMSQDQIVLLEKWKKGRETTRGANVYVIDANGETDRRFVRLGISDDQYTEILGGQLAEGERVVLRARETEQ